MSLRQPQEHLLLQVLNIITLIFVDDQALNFEKQRWMMKSIDPCHSERLFGLWFTKGLFGMAFEGII